jgi:hypothetical protein
MQNFHSLRTMAAKMVRGVALLFLAGALLACAALPTQTPATAPPPSPSPAPANLATLAPAVPSPTAAIAATLAPTATPVPADLPAPLYTISATLDYAAHSLSVIEQIAYTNRTGEPLTSLLLIADMQTFPGALDLQEVKSSAGPGAAQVVSEKTHITLTLDQPLQPGGRIVLDAAFNLRLPQRSADPAMRPMVFGWSEHQTNLVDWYLYIPPYQPGTGWQAHNPGYYGEHQVYEASDFVVNLSVANPPTGLQVAASAEEQTDGDWRRYELQQARTFALSLSPNFIVTQLTVGDVTLIGYAFSYHAAAGEAALKTAAQSVELFSRLFGAYPHRTLAVVEADFLDGMEYDGLFFLSNGFYNLYHGTPGEYLVALSAHETAHQWWFSRVGSDQAVEPWLDEALSTYSERLYYENLAPSALDWWLQVRVLYYKPHGYVDDSIYNPHHEAQAYRAYRDAVYLNGALFLQELRQLIGDEAFFAALLDYSTRFDGKLAKGADFFQAVRAHSPSDLGPLTQKYFASPP